MGNRGVITFVADLDKRGRIKEKGATFDGMEQSPNTPDVNGLGAGRGGRKGALAVRGSYVSYQRDYLFDL